MPTYGVIDLGSNTVRLVVYEASGGHKAACTGTGFRSIINDKVMAGLAAHVQDGAFTQAGIDRAIGVLKGHLKRARYFGCARIDIFATAVLRNCTNSEAAIAAIEEGIRMPIDLLSARDEAHLGFVGATCDRVIERGTLVDIGGGSTELTRIEGGRDFDNASIGQGSLSSYAEFVEMILPTAQEAAAIEESFWTRATALPSLDAYRTPLFYGVGGSVRAAAKMHAQLHGVQARPKVLAPAHVAAIVELATGQRSAFSHHAVKAVPERIHTLVPGAVIAHALLSRLGAESLEICKHGVREGYLIERMLAE